MAGSEAAPSLASFRVLRGSCWPGAAAAVDLRFACHSSSWGWVQAMHIDCWAFDVSGVDELAAISGDRFEPGQVEGAGCIGL